MDTRQALDGSRYAVVSDSIHMPASVRKVGIMDYQTGEWLARTYSTPAHARRLARIARALNNGMGPQKERAQQECNR